MVLSYGSVCSGIEAASVAWHPLGWRASFLSEIEAFPSAVLAHHYPKVPNYGDMTAFKDWPDHAIDLLVGGTPCQSFSVAGLRAGLADPRGSLMLTYLAIAARYRPRWVVWENVPGVLSSNGGRDFGTFLGGLGELGYGFAYRVLDAQFCRASGFARAVPQRRRRVFVVGYLGDWRRAAAVLFDAASLRGDPPPSRAAGQGLASDVVSSLTASGRGVERTGETRGQDPVVAVASGSLARSAERWPAEVASILNAHFGDKMGLEDQHALHGAPLFVPVVTNALTNNNGQRNEVSDMVNGLVAFDTTQITSKANFSNPQPGDPCHPLASGAHPPAVATNCEVRRLMPEECETLQGFPPKYTAVPYRNKPAADGPRYKALGNSMAVNVMRVIGSRIQLVEDAKE
jgi:DNA (cytosine-5)-methyltransferase 1